jgi:hypothetical protein
MKLLQPVGKVYHSPEPDTVVLTFPAVLKG